MASTGILATIQKFTTKNAPTILTVMGAVGTVAAVILSSEAAIKAKKDIAIAEHEKKQDQYADYISAKSMVQLGESIDNICEALTRTEEEVKDILVPPLSTSEKAVIYAKAYAPTAIMTTASLFCIFGSNKISKARIAALASAYIASESNLKEYKDKVLEIAGKKKKQEIEDTIVQDKVLNNPPTAANTLPPSMTNQIDLSLWYDVTSDRYFYSNADIIRKAEIEAQSMLNENGFVSLNDIYSMIGIKEIPLGNDIGWEYRKNDTIILKIGAVLDDKNQPVGTLTVEVRTSNEWLGMV